MPEYSNVRIQVRFPNGASVNLDSDDRDCSQFACFDVAHKLGAGSFGAAYLVQLNSLDKTEAEACYRQGNYRRANLSVTNESLELVLKTGEIPRHWGQLRKEVAFIRRVYGGPARLEFKDGNYYILMPRVPGQKLTVALSSPRLSTLDRLHIFLAVAKAMKELHEEHGIVHGDTHLGNFFIEHDQESGYQVHLLDFGLSSRVDEPLIGMSQLKRAIHIDPDRFGRKFFDRESPASEDIYSFTKSYIYCARGGFFVLRVAAAIENITDDQFISLLEGAIRLEEVTQTEKARNSGYQHLLYQWLQFPENRRFILKSDTKTIESFIKEHVKFNSELTEPGEEEQLVSQIVDHLKLVAQHQDHIIKQLKRALIKQVEDAMVEVDEISDYLQEKINLPNKKLWRDLFEDFRDKVPLVLLSEADLEGFKKWLEKNMNSLHHLEEVEQPAPRTSSGRKRSREACECEQEIEEQSSKRQRTETSKPVEQTPENQNNQQQVEDRPKRKPIRSSAFFQPSQQQENSPESSRQAQVPLHAR